MQISAIAELHERHTSSHSLAAKSEDILKGGITPATGSHGGHHGPEAISKPGGGTGGFTAELDVTNETHKKSVVVTVSGKITGTSYPSPRSRIRSSGDRPLAFGGIMYSFNIRLRNEGQRHDLALSSRRLTLIVSSRPGQPRSTCRSLITKFLQADLLHS